MKVRVNAIVLLLKKKIIDVIAKIHKMIGKYGFFE